MGVLEKAQVADQLWRKDVDNRLDEHFERLGRHEELIAQHEKQFARGGERMSAIETKLDTNTAITQRIEANTGTLVTWVQNFTGFKNVVTWLAGLLIGLAVIIGAAGVVWWWFHSGELPKKP